MSTHPGHDPARFALRPEDVLAHQGALRALARRLVQDEGVADDVVQDAWLAALRSGPRRTGVGGLRSWLVTVLRNAARKEGRGTQRRADREAVAARPDPLPPTEEVAERAAMHREIVDRVLALDEPYRTVLLLRYFEDLPPRRIAERVDATVATVNQQLLRGRQRLREALDAKYGRRADWRGFFLLALGREAPTAIGAASTGWLGSLPIQLAAGVLVLGGGIWLAEELTQDPVLPLSEVTLAPPPGERVPQETPVPGMGSHVAADRSPHPGPQFEPVDREARPDPPGRIEEQGADGTRPWDLGSVVTRSRGRRRAGPPGTVLLKGGNFKMGARVSAAQQRIRQHPGRAAVVVAETPRHPVSLAPYHLMTTEVTNEQYHAFLRATGSDPPRTWGGTGCPEELLALPVTGVDYGAAARYAAWAGLRLPTEAEMQFAASRKRGGDWKEDVWRDPNRGSAWSVGANPLARTKDGVHDVVGNVWEWTSSPYTAFEGYEPLGVRAEDGSYVEAIAAFDESLRVVYGGCYLLDESAHEPTVRRATATHQATEALGFRCGTSEDRVFEHAVELLRTAASPLAADVAFQPEPAVLLERWTSEEGTARERSGQGRLDEYAVITGYDRVLFVPARVPDLTPGDLVERSLGQGPIVVGILETTIPMIAPPLPPGRFIVSYCAPGGGPEGVVGGSRAVLGLVPGQTNLLFQDLEGEAVAAVGWRGEPRFLEAAQVQAGRVTLYNNPDSGVDSLELSVSLPGPAKGHGVELSVYLGVPGGTFDSGWIF